MLTFLTLLFWAGVVAGLVALVGWINARRFAVETLPGAIHFATTEDGWRLTLRRYRPETPLSGAPPVVLCPGAGMNGTVFDVSRETSLARYLAGHGHDVWVLDLRGRGPWGRRRGGNWSFDDYVEFDVPAALRLVLQETGARQAQWVGVGVGALVIFGALAGRDAQRSVCSVASLAGGVFFHRQQAVFRPGLLRRLRWLRPELLARLLAPLLGRLFPGQLKLLQNRDNIDGAIYRRALVSGLERMARTELLQYAEWLEHDTFTAVVQRRDYRATMASIKAPTLFIVGPRDELAPVEALEATSNLLDAAEDRVLVLASRMHGMSTNYGHLDLLLGRGVQRDIYTHLLRWLDLHAGVEIPQDRPEPPEPREGWSGEGYPHPPKSREDETPRSIDVQESVSGQDKGEEDDDGDEEQDGLGAEDEEDPVQGDVPRIPPG